MRKITLLTAIFFFQMHACVAAEPINVVTTTSTFAGIAKKVGGERISVKRIASPKYNIHFIQPKPSDVRNTANADLFIHGGMDLEAWVDPLLEAAAKPDLFKGEPRNLDASSGITPMNVPAELTRAAGDIHAQGNPHYMLSPKNAVIVAHVIADKLSQIDPAGKEEYQRRANEFVQEMSGKISEWTALCENCPGMEIISYHDDIAYLAGFLGIRAEKFIEPKPGVPPTPKHLLFLERYIRDNGIRVIATASYYSRAQAEALAKKTGAKLVVIGQSAGEIEGTEDIVDFYDMNIRSIAEALK